MTQELRGGLTMIKESIEQLIEINLTALAGLALAVVVVIIFNVIDLSITPNPKQKDYILHSITSDGTAFYLYMDEEEYQQWASENHIKIKKLELQKQ